MSRILVPLTDSCTSVAQLIANFHCFHLKVFAEFIRKLESKVKVCFGTDKLLRPDTLSGKIEEIRQRNYIQAINLTQETQLGIAVSTATR